MAENIDANGKILNIGDKIHPLGRGAEVWYVIELKDKFIDISPCKNGKATCCVLSERFIKFKNQQ